MSHKLAQKAAGNTKNISEPQKLADQSQRVQQKDKLSQNLNIREFNWTEKQKQFFDIALDKDTKIMIVDGPAGSSKTLCSIYCSLLLLNQRKVSDLIYIRSLIQSRDGETGFLTGDLDEKTKYFNVPLNDKLQELLDVSSIKLLQKENRIITYPTSMLRGYSFNCQAICCDESQNCHFDSLVTIATRIGKFSKLFMMGDSRLQNDYGAKSGFNKFIDIFSDEESSAKGIRYFKFDNSDILRSDIVQYIVTKLETYYQNKTHF